MARKTRNKSVYRDHDIDGSVNVVYTPTTKRYSFHDRYSIYRQKVKRVALYSSPRYLITPKPIRKLLAQTNIPTVRTMVRNKIRGRELLGRAKKCQHNQEVRRRNYFRKTRGHGGSRPPHKRQHKC